MRPKRSIPIVGLCEFQFTHPGKGATRREHTCKVGSWVSIHAPWEGCDYSLFEAVSSENRFQFTHPGKGATKYNLASQWAGLGFNSRTLGRVRLTVCTAPSPQTCFNSRTLGRVRRNQYVYPHGIDQVSIHAPWEGCDDILLEISIVCGVFQFTHPGKGATSLRLLVVHLV